MTPEQFRELGHRAIDRIADYMRRVERPPVQSPVEPGEIASRLPESPPQAGESWDAVFDDLDRIVQPGLTHWQSPNFFGYFPANASGPAILGELFSAGFGVQGMLWSTSPACTEIETRMLDWLAEAIGLPRSFTSRVETGGGAIQSTASESTLVALVAARQRLFSRNEDRARPDSNAARSRSDEESSASRLTVYCSDQAHSSVDKAAMIAGLGRDRVRRIRTDTTLAMDPAALAGAIDEDLAAGRTPFLIVATVGTTSSGAVDPLTPIGRIARDRGMWLHVDAAWAGAACVCPEHRWMLEGVESADSFNFNPHKWLLTNFDCSAFWTQDRANLTDALSITPEYLRNKASESGEVIDYRDWQIPLGRRFRALKLWFVMRHYGSDGLRAHIREHVRLAEWFESQVCEDERFELAAPRSLALVCFRLKASDEANRALLDRLNGSGRIFLTHTALPDPSRGGEQRLALRLAIGAAATRESHVRAAWDLIRAEAANALSSG